MANRLNEIDWFKWNDVKCTEKGIHVLQQPAFIRPSERCEDVEIPGKSGSLTMLEGDDVFDNISIGCSCIINDAYVTESGVEVSRISRISSWLRGNGKVEFATHKNGYYKGRIANQISFDKILSGYPHKAFSVEFQCEPFFYLYGWNLLTETSTDFQTYYKNYYKRTWDSANETYVYTKLESQETFAENTYFYRVYSFSTSSIISKTMVNIGNIASEPLIRIDFGSNDNTYVLTTSEPSDFRTNYQNYYTKSGSTYTALTSATTWEANTYYKPASLTLICGGTETMLIEDVHELPYIILDSEAKIAYTGEENTPFDPFLLRTGRISSGEWIKFNEGSNIFTWSWTGGSPIHFTIDPRWRCI